jgi:hypothetical protein
MVNKENNMRNVNLKDREMPLADYKEFQDTRSAGFSGSFNPKVELLPGGMVRLTECCIEMSPTEMRPSMNRASVNEEKQLQITLEYFIQNGFEQAS